MATLKPAEVAEFQGFYGPFTVTERLLQKIWLRGDFNTAGAATLVGEPVEISFPGKWNLLEGPDFRNARLRIAGREVTGDIELHFHLADWAKHRHHLDEAYDRVVLHVLLFQPAPGETPAFTASGREPPALVLLDLLHHDLEEYAAEDAIEATLERSHWQATQTLVALPLEERRQSLRRHARLRWEQKLRFARLRAEKLGWPEACHQTALEILGYRRNRGAMLNLATRYPLAEWQRELPGEDALLSSSRWIAQGSRPANHPRQRLRQYLQMVQARPHWPEKLREAFSAVTSGGARGRASPPADAAAPGAFRAGQKLKVLREQWTEAITGGFIGGSRLDTLFCDGFLPLAATESGRGEELFSYWFAWYAGDYPDRVVRTLRTADITDRRTFVTCNGLCQGVLSLSLEQHNDPLVCF